MNKPFLPLPAVAAALSGVLLAAPAIHAAPPAPVAKPANGGDTALLAGLKPGSWVGGFRAQAVYLNDAERPLGARFVHEKTGFTLDVLRIQTAPQMFLWVNTPPTSDKGEPHTQEHLLLGKGNRGRYVASLEDLSLAGSSAYTMQWRTCYFSYTEAGGDVFFRLLEGQLGALLHPDYSDEEVRREVRNWGVTANKDGTLRLDEKGTVYNEMVSSSDRPGNRVWRAMLTALYGSGHPLSSVSGGSPEALRTLTPADIRAFHRRAYRLGNMGMIAAWPREMPLSATLTRMDALLSRLEPGPKAMPRAENTVPRFPAPRAAPAGSVFLAPYPDANAQQQGDVYFVWPAARALNARDETLLGMFLDAFAGDTDSNLYKRFVDSKTRARDTGAQGVFGWVSSDPGQPVFVGLNGVPAARRTDAEMRTLRQEVRAEFARVAAYKDGSPELAAFNRRVRDLLTQRRRGLSKFVNSPPGFGFRGSSSGWMEQLLLLERTGGFRRSVTLKPEMQAIAALLNDKRNIWRERLAAWKLTNALPFAATARPDPEMMARQAEEKRARAEAETTRLLKVYGVADAQEAIRRYQAEYDRNTAVLEAAAKGAPPLRFLERPPLTPDELLDYKVSSVGGVPQVASTFEDTTGAMAGLALRLDGIPPESRFLLSALPSLLSQAGVIENGKPLSYEQVLERQRREVLSVSASYSTNATTRRAELVVAGAGNDPREGVNAVAWMRRYLLAPDWRPENLPRLRDLVDQQLAGLRNRMKGSEESWVNAVSGAYYRQDDPLLLSINSFFTRAHDAHRLRWRLMDAAAPEDRTAAIAYLDSLAAAGAGAKRDDLRALLAALQSDKEDAAPPLGGLAPHRDALTALTPGARHVITEAAKDLALTLPDMPDDSLGADWAYLCRQMARDLSVGPEKTLAELDALRRGLLRTGGARLYVVGSRTAQREIARPVADLVARLETAPAPPDHALIQPAVVARLRERSPEAAAPVYVGLIAPDLQSGVFLNSAKGTSYRDTDAESVLRYLSVNLYGGGVAEGVFMKTWGAGLAYSNGLGASPASGRVTYYAERTPELPQTLRFVIDLLKNSPKNPRLAEYAVAAAFGGGRAAGGYESRGEQMAADLADRNTPDVVRAFRKAVLSVRARPDLTDALYARMPGEVGKVLPGFGPKAADVPDAVRFVIGPEKQFAAYEAYLKETEGPGTTLYRLYPRDFWLPLPEALSVTAVKPSTP
jgi:Zn-dependent M16 (insulinase) family peptidase